MAVNVALVVATALPVSVNSTARCPGEGCAAVIHLRSREHEHARTAGVEDFTSHGRRRLQIGPGPLSLPASVEYLARVSSLSYCVGKGAYGYPSPARVATMECAACEALTNGGSEFVEVVAEPDALWGLGLFAGYDAANNLAVVSIQGLDEEWGDMASAFMLRDVGEPWGSAGVSGGGAPIAMSQGYWEFAYGALGTTDPETGANVPQEGCPAAKVRQAITTLSHAVTNSGAGCATLVLVGHSVGAAAMQVVASDVMHEWQPWHMPTDPWFHDWQPWLHDWQPWLSDPPAYSAFCALKHVVALSGPKAFDAGGAAYYDETSGHGWATHHVRTQHASEEQMVSAEGTVLTNGTEHIVEGEHDRYNGVWATAGGGEAC